MKSKKLLTTLLLGIGLCFVSILGYAEIKEYENMDAIFEQARTNYMMTNPNSYLYVNFYYDSDGWYKKFFPEGVNTKNKIIIEIIDNRNMFSLDKRRRMATQAFVFYLRKQLRAICSFIPVLTIDMNADIVAGFYNTKSASIGYFCEGKYFLWNSWEGKYYLAWDECPMSKKNLEKGIVAAKMGTKDGKVRLGRVSDPTKHNFIFENRDVYIIIPWKDVEWIEIEDESFINKVPNKFRHIIKRELKKV